MIKIIFYIQIVFAIVCDTVAWIVNLTPPLANFESRLASLEKLISQGEGTIRSSQHILDALHYFIIAIYQGGLVSFYMLQITCMGLFIGGIMGLKEHYSIQK